MKAELQEYFKILLKATQSGQLDRISLQICLIVSTYLLRSKHIHIGQWLLQKALHCATVSGRLFVFITVMHSKYKNGKSCRL